MCVLGQFVSEKVRASAKTKPKGEKNTEYFPWNKDVNMNLDYILFVYN